MIFEDWMKKVDVTLYQKTGMMSADLPDWRYRDDFDDKLSATSSAARAIKNAKDELLFFEIWTLTTASKSSKLMVLTKEK